MIIQRWKTGQDITNYITHDATAFFLVMFLTLAGFVSIWRCALKLLSVVSQQHTLPWELHRFPPMLLLRYARYDIVIHAANFYASSLRHRTCSKLSFTI